jgi:DNA repair exonuclease SbcCD ATPase subunit
MLSVNIKNLQKEEQEKRSEYRTLDEQLKVLKEKTKRQTQKIDDLEKFKQEIKQDLKEYLKEHTTKKDNKYYINNIQDFYLSLVDTFEFASNLNVKIEELEKLKNINEILKEHLQKANDKSEYLSEQIKKVDVLYVKIKKLIDENNSLKDENYLLNNFIKEKNLEAEFGKFKNQDYECSHDFEM